MENIIEEKAKRVYNNISDCWQALREAQTKEEVEELFRWFPRWSGDWECYWENKHLTVQNTYQEFGADQIDREDLDIEYPYSITVEYEEKATGRRFVEFGADKVEKDAHDLYCEDDATGASDLKRVATEELKEKFTEIDRYEEEE